jgi:hypothetical protein
MSIAFNYPKLILESDKIYRVNTEFGDVRSTTEKVRNGTDNQYYPRFAANV